MRYRPSPLSDPLIVPIRTDGAEAMATLHATGFDPAWSPQSFTELFEARDARAFGIFTDENLISYALILPSVQDMELATIVTAPDYRGQGLAERLLLHVMPLLKADGFERFLLEVSEENLSARSLYNRVGFKTDGRRPNYYKSESGGYCAAILMSFELNEPR